MQIIGPFILSFIHMAFMVKTQTYYVLLKKKKKKQINLPYYIGSVSHHISKDFKNSQSVKGIWRFKLSPLHGSLIIYLGYIYIGTNITSEIMFQR